MASRKDPRFPCAWCGESVIPGRKLCPHCGEELPNRGDDDPVPLWVELDLHDDLPTWEVAKRRLHEGLAELALGRAQALLIVHGWGKGGSGGLIKRQVQRRLDEWAENTWSKSWFAGEALAKDEQWQDLPQRFAKAKRLREKVQGNQGVSLVLG